MGLNYNTLQNSMTPYAGNQSYYTPQNFNGKAGFNFNINSELQIADKNYISFGLKINEIGFTENGLITNLNSKETTEYEFDNRFIFYGITLGHRFDFIQRNRTKFFIENKFGYQKQGTNKGLKGNAFSYTVGFGVDYQINYKLSLMTKFTFMSAISGYGVMFESFRQNQPYSFGVNVGLSYKMI